MEMSAVVVVVLGTLLFIGFPVWLTLNSRQKPSPSKESFSCQVDGH